MALEEFNHFFQESVDTNGIDIDLLSAPSTINLFKKYRRHGLPYFYYNADTREEFGELPENILSSYFALCKKLVQKADISYDEYKKYLDVFYKVTGSPNGSTIKECMLICDDIGPDKKRDSLVKFANGTPKPYNKTIRLFHTSENPNITKLKPFFRSQSHRYVEALFPVPRIYFGYNDICSRMIARGTKGDSDDQIKKRFFDRDDLFVYEYTGPPEYIKKVYTDPELGGVAVYVETDHELPVKRITFDEFKNGIKNKNIQESYYGPDDNTTGTSEFDINNDNDPDDCYCESVIRSNAVYINGRSIEKINDFQFDKVYFGSPNKLPTTMKLDGPLFVSPYPGIASIFSVRPQNLQKYGVPNGVRCNRDYDEWNRSLKDTVLQKPLTELHVRIQAENINIKPTTELVSGYLYTIDVTPEIRDHIYQSSKMSKVFEFCIDKMDSITFSDIKKINVRMTVTGENIHIQEAYDAITGEEIPIDHAYTMDDMKERTYTEEELIDTIQEAKLPSKKRTALDDSDFALVYTDTNGKKIRKYPVHDKAHVESAARMFPRGVPLKYQGKVARKILRRAHEFGIDTSGWKNLNKFKERD